MKLGFKQGATLTNRPNPLTDDEYNQSQSDKKSYYSQAGRARIQFNFEEKNEDYLDDDTPSPNPKTPISTMFPKMNLNSANSQHAPGYIMDVNRAPPRHPIHQQHPHLSNFHAMSENINYKSESSTPQAAASSTGMQTSQTLHGFPAGNRKVLPQKIQARQYDYDRLYKKIKLTPMAQERNESETLQQIDPKVSPSKQSLGYKNIDAPAIDKLNDMYKDTLFPYQRRQEQQKTAVHEQEDDNKMEESSVQRFPQEPTVSTHNDEYRVGSLKSSQVVDEERRSTSTYKSKHKEFRPFIKVSELTNEFKQKEQVREHTTQQEEHKQKSKQVSNQTNSHFNSRRNSESSSRAPKSSGKKQRQILSTTFYQPASVQQEDISQHNSRKVQNQAPSYGKTDPQNRNFKYIKENSYEENKSTINDLEPLANSRFQEKPDPIFKEQPSIQPFIEEPEKPRLKAYSTSTTNQNRLSRFQKNQGEAIQRPNDRSVQHDRSADVQHTNHNQEDHDETQEMQALPSVSLHEESAAEFDFKTYLQLYFSLKNIQAQLKTSQLLKSVKSYLQIIATGKVDNYQYLRVPLHKKKILKLALLYERVSIIIIAFAYASNTLAQSQRYLSNLIKYAISNYLCILKVITNENPKETTNLNEMPRDVREIVTLSQRQFQAKGFQTIRDNNDILVQTIFRLSKYDNLFYQNLKKFIKNSNKFSVEQTFYFVLEYFAFFLNLCELQHKVPFLAVAPNPYLPPAQNQKYTLVIDFLEVMCHPKKGDLFRPYSQYFFDQMSQYYEIVTFCTSFPNQANKVIDLLDKKKKIQYKLYRHHAIKVIIQILPKINGVYLKDMSRLGRDLSKTILIDCQHQYFKLNKQNAICIKGWSGSSKDTALAQLCPMLAMVVIKKMDARDALAKYKEQMTKNEKSGVKYINFGMNLD